MKLSIAKQPDEGKNPAIRLPHDDLKLLAFLIATARYESGYNALKKEVSEMQGVTLEELGVVSPK